MKICELCGHTQEWGDLSCYRNDANGISKDIHICNDCLYAHVSKYYPGCPIQKHLEYMYPEKFVTPNQPTS